MPETGKTRPPTTPLEKAAGLGKGRLNDIIGADDYEFGAEEAPGGGGAQQPTTLHPQAGGPGRAGPPRR